MPGKFVSNVALLNLLGSATTDERSVLTKLLNANATSDLSAEKLQVEICRVGGHGVANWLRGQGTGYIDILDDIVQALKIPNMPSYVGTTQPGGLSLWEIDKFHIIRAKGLDAETCGRAVAQYAELAEGKILLKLLEVTYERLSPEQRDVFDARVREVASSFGEKSAKGLVGSAGLLVIGNLGGFATYTLMSTVLSSLSLGTLGFGAYTFASSALSVALGPVGWLALGVAGIYSAGKATHKQTIPLIANVAMIRQRVGSRERQPKRLRNT